ncbi:MAG: hypothetical protein KDK66_00800 [Deltaproteobacteria bacterium]|nr:hypothetical protein [Deltaproteobacteria bacterium]
MLRVYLKNQRGFTMIELVMLIFLLSLSVAIAAPSLDINGGQVNMAVIKVAQELNYAQNRAIVTGIPHGFRTTSSHGYEIYEGTTGNAIWNPSTGQPFNVDLNDYFNSVNFQGDYSVEFDALGRPDAAGDLTFVLSNGEETNTFTVEYNTGRVALPF